MFMNNKRLIFYAVFAAFHFGAFIFTIILQNNVGLLLQMASWVPWFKYATFIGVALLITDFVWAYKVNRDEQKEKDALNKELTQLKAKLFDLQEGKNTPVEKTPKP